MRVGETTRWFAGVDWSSERHQVCLLDVGGKVVSERAFAHGGAGLAALCDWVVSVAGDLGLVGMAIEVPHGPVVDALLDRGFAVHAINPKQLDHLRDRFSVAGAKDDRRDAWVTAAGLAAPCAGLPTGCSGSPVSCCSVKRCSTPITPRQLRRDLQTFLGSTGSRHSFVPTAPRQSAARKRCPGGRAAAPA